MNKKILITIDGPAGSGKTTVSKLLAERLGYLYVDTGALYRGVAYAVRSSGIDAADDQAVARLCRDLDLRFVASADGPRLRLGGADISALIRDPAISMMASAVSARPVVRQHLMSVQRAMGRDKGVVFEGRDMGTVVFPDADVKFYLHASLSVRAGRRFRELGNEKGGDYGRVMRDMEQRDRQDTTREMAPLRPAEDAIVIDTTQLGISRVVDIMVHHIENMNRG